MAVQVFVKGLRVGGVAFVRIELGEAAVVLVVPAGAEIVLLEGSIVVFAGITQIGLRRCAVADSRTDAYDEICNNFSLFHPTANQVIFFHPIAFHDFIYFTSMKIMNFSSPCNGQNISP